MGPRARRRGATGPAWTPFPVQDWNAYARTQGWRSSRHGSHWLTVICALVVLAGGGVLVAIDLPAVLAADRRERFVPADGDQVDARLTLPGTEPLAAVVASSVLPVPVTSQLLPRDLGSTLLGAVAGDPETRVWRRSTTTDRGSRYELYTVDGGVRLLARSHPRLAGFGGGGIPLVPAGVEPGRRWQAEGPVLTDGGRWRTDLGAEDAGQGCLRIAGTVTVTGGTAGETLDRIEQRWCPGTGLVAQRSTGPDGSTVETTEPTPDPSEATPVTVDRPEPEAVDVRAWTETVVVPRERVPGTDGVSTRQELAGIATGTPRRTASGALVVGSSADLIVFRGRGVDWFTQVRLHPGGAVLGWQVFGDVVVATTSERALVGYDSRTGRRWWRLELPDTAHPGFARLDDRTIVVGLSSGEVITVDLVTGAIGGRVDTRPGQAPAMATAGGEVVIITPDNDVALHRGVALEAVWSVEPPDVANTVLISADRVWVRSAIGLEGLDRDDGSYLWHRAQPGGGAVHAGAAGLAHAVAGEVTLVDPAGRLRWTVPSTCEELRPLGPDLLGCLRADELVWLGPDGATVARWPVADHQEGALGWAPRTDGVVLRPRGGWSLSWWGPVEP